MQLGLDYQVGQWIVPGNLVVEDRQQIRFFNRPMWYPYLGFLEGCSYACACSTRDSRRGAFFIASKPSPKRDAL